MPDVFWLGLFSLVGTLIGTYGGILASNKLTCYRIQELEKKVDKHNNFAGRMPLLEQKVEFLEEQLHSK